MALSKVICVFFGFLFLANPFLTIYARNNNANVPFEVNQVIEQVTTQQKSHHTDHWFYSKKTPYQISEDLQGEFMIDTTRFFVPGGYEASAPSITFDGTNYFVVWGDNNREAVLGTRVTQTGEILDKPAIKIATGNSDWSYFKPSVAYGAGVYLSVWSDYRSYGYLIFGARTNTAGVLLDTIPIPICTTYFQGYHPSVAFDGANFLVVFDNWDSVIGARVSPAGVVLDTLGIIISAALSEQNEPTVCFGGDNYFVAWNDHAHSVDGARVSTEGVVLDTNRIRILTGPLSQSPPAVTFGGSNYFVVWSIGETYIYGARIDQNGTVLDTSGIAISNDYYGSNFPSVTFDGTNYLSVWEVLDVEYGNIYSRRIDTTGMVLDSSSIICTTEVLMYTPAVVFGGTSSFVVWDDSRINRDIFGARVNNEGIVLDSAGLPVSYSVNNQGISKVAFDGTNYLVVWGSSIWDETPIKGIYGARVSPTGVILDSTGIPISPQSFWEDNARVIFGGSNYLVVWEEVEFDTSLGIYGVRVSLNGTVLDSTFIPISTGHEEDLFDVAFDGANYFVVWGDDRAGISVADIYGARVSTTGVVLDPAGIPISTADRNQHDAQVIFDGTNYFVCWNEYINSYDNVHIYGARVTPEGVVLDTAGIPISTVVSGKRLCQVVIGGTNYFVCWSDNRNGSNNVDIYGARVTPEGMVLDTTGIPISTASGHQYADGVVSGANQYFVVWDDYRNNYPDIYGARITTDGMVLDPEGIPVSIAAEADIDAKVVFDGSYYVVVWDRGGYVADEDIYGARLNTSGVVVDTFSVSTQTGFQYPLSLTHGSGNQVLVTYYGWTEVYRSKPYYTYRVWGEFAPPPGVEESKVTTDLNSPIFRSSPNPFNHFTTIRYSVRNSGNVSIKIYDIAGKLVRNLVNGNKKPGVYSINWNGTDDLNKKLPAGVYFYQLKNPNETSVTKQLIILR